jgi:hypothetical protein
MEYAHLINQDYDLDFGKNPALRWIPWVGRRWKELDPKHRLLIIGESHYIEERPEQSIESIIQLESANKEFTREVIWECPVSGWWNNRTLENISRTILNAENRRASEFWQNISYYNHIQRLMRYQARSERPTAEDFSTGWNAFMVIAEKLRPSACIFLGSEARHSFYHAMTENRGTFENVIRGDRVGRCFAYHARVTISDHSVPLLWIQHPSRYFNTTKWHRLIHYQFPDPIDFLNREPS